MKGNSFRLKEAYFMSTRQDKGRRIIFVPEGVEARAPRWSITLGVSDFLSSSGVETEIKSMEN
jgi:hypothetical protein